MRRFLQISLPLFAALLWQGCREAYTPKPHAYPRVVYPSRSYVPFNPGYCKFTFDQPAYMTVVQDSLYFDTKAPDPCWFNLHIPAFNGDIHFTYRPIKSKDDVYKVFDEAYRMASQHNKKADANTDYMFNNPEERVYGVLYEIDGFVASTFQFAVTDSVKHALRGALYFNARPDPDSLKPVIDFVRTDMMQILNTLHWTE